MRAPDKLQSLRELRRRNIPIETIVDVGILTGTSELVTVFPDKRHILFEPVEEFASTIRWNYRQVDHVLVTAAVGPCDGEATLQVRSIVGGMKISHSGVISGPADSPDKRRVPMVSLDAYFARSPYRTPYLVKLDVDGLELPIMQGGLETLRNSSVVIVEAPKHSLTKRIAFLEELGFEIFDLVQPCYYDKSFWQCDAVMLKRNLQSDHFSQLATAFEAHKYEAFQLSDQPDVA